MEFNFYRFWMPLCLQHGIHNRRCFASGSQSSILRKPCFTLCFNTFSKFGALEIRSKIDRDTNLDSRLVTRFGSHVDTLFGRFWESKNRGRTFRNPMFWDLEKLRFCEGHATRIAAASPARWQGLSAIQLVMRMLRSA